MTATAINANQTAASAILENDTTDAQSSVTPQEIGMMFVHEYYNFLHDDPQKLHLFYNKNSSYLHGEEGDLNVKLVNGNQQIRKAITDLNLNNCMVMVSSVDSMSSANNGIIVQVLGEMSNQGTEARKFAQTFFLAEQPKGYYVLNDIFRFLREDIDYEEGVTEEEVAAVEEKVAEPDQEQSAVSMDDAQTAAVEATQVAEAKPDEEPSPAVVPEVKETPVTKTEESNEKSVEQVANGVASEGSAKEQQQQQQRPKKSKADGDKQKQKQHDRPASAAKSNAPKTWANLAANDSEKWGTQVAEAKGPVASVPVNPPKQSPQQQQQQLQTKQPTKTENISIFVKNVQQTMTEDQLKEAFGKFGAIKTLTVVHSKSCAFLDFSHAESAHKALSQQKITIGSAVVLAEERRPQGGRGQYEGRRQNGEGRGGFENRRGGMHRGGDKQASQQQADGQQSERGNRRGNAGRGGDRKGNNTNKSQPNAQANSPASK
ncbi:hypothetical protein K450DRAFT_218736 [Umbelopsis ramanniana AG]|uniref:NTF2-domain-containing protein n=1 Tax=Umbelopsis ramanniana AG TaxID=1314678 RepID=A0AAD5EJF9_UMBRA|nr:uncharacterized protein K450DRAFT_218736 [Umbelopsis ramanniana AG]KAI8584225.1 hypothetical protein K450DRAFT_218736 [Umbelopsis ramanniana AG]